MGLGEPCEIEAALTDEADREGQIDARREKPGDVGHLHRDWIQRGRANLHEVRRELLPDLASRFPPGRRETVDRLPHPVARHLGPLADDEPLPD